MTRIEKLLQKVSKDHKIIEIGPSYNPLLRRTDGWDYHTLDHATAEELREKYGADPKVDVSRIAQVDYVWHGGTMDSAVPEAALGTFDVCLASHVTEHQPDLVSYLQAASRLLKAGGLLSLAIPDKRFCFDTLMSVSTTGDVLEAHDLKRTRHSRKSVFQMAAYNARAAGETTWGQSATGELSFFNDDIRLAKKAFDGHDTSPERPYTDAHAWYFTPSSFRLIVLELGLLGLVDFVVEDHYPADGCEFIISLRKSGPPPHSGDSQMQRLALLKQIQWELREQAEYLFPSGKADDGLSEKEIAYLDMDWSRRRDRQIAKLLRENTRLEEKLAASRAEAAAVRKAVSRWNERSWVRRAFHKLRLPKRDS
jgi:predicted SAM-dependent methyltransferase